MKFANATKLNRKFGVAEWRDLRFLFSSHADSEAPTQKPSKNHELWRTTDAVELGPFRSPGEGPKQGSYHFSSIFYGQYNPPCHSRGHYNPNREYSRLSRKHIQPSPEGIEEKRRRDDQERTQHSLHQEPRASKTDGGLGERHAYQKMQANADEGAHQGADRDPDGTNSLHQPDTQHNIDACLSDRGNRGQMLLAGGDDNKDVGQDKLANDIAQNQHFEIESTLCGIFFPNP